MFAVIGSWIAGQGVKIATSLIAKYWPYILIGIAVTAAVIWVWVMHVRLENRAVQITELQNALADRDAALRALRQGYTANLTALTHELDATRQRAATAAARKDILTHARPEDDGPAVILDDLLDRLQPAAGTGG